MGDEAENANVELEKTRLEFERETTRDDFSLRKAELELRREELKFKSGWLNPITLAILAGTATLFGNIIVTYMQGANALTLERSKLSSNLILEAIKTGDTDQAVKNLAWMLKIGLIEDSQGKIAENISIENIPVLPPSPFTANGALPEYSVSIQRGGFQIVAQSQVTRLGDLWRYRYTLLNKSDSAVEVVWERAMADMKSIIQPGETMRNEFTSAWPPVVIHTTLYFGVIGESESVLAYVPQSMVSG